MADQNMNEPAGDATLDQNTAGTGEPFARQPLMVQGIPVEDIKAFVGKNADYYIGKFTLIESYPGFSWNPFSTKIPLDGINIGALFVSYYWGFFVYLFYRKMYLYGLISFCSYNLYGLVTGLSIGNTHYFFTETINLAAAAFTNIIYLRFSIIKINKLKQLRPDFDVNDLLKNKRGVNYTIPAILIFLYYFIPLSEKIWPEIFK